VKTNITIATALTGIKKLPFSDRGGIFIYNLVSNFKLNPLLWITFLLGMAYLVFARGQVKKILSTTIIILVAQFSSLFLVGHPFGYHYLMTSMPIMCLVSGFFVSKWLSGSKIRKNLNYFATFLLIFGSILYSLQGNVLKYYKEIFSHYTHKQLPRNDSCFKIAKYLTTAGVKDKYIYMVNSCQIVYWLTESRYPTKYIHPSNLFLKEYMLKIIDGPNATKERELLKILGKNPAFIVYRKDLWPVQLESFKTILDEKLHTGYKLINIIDTDYLIYKSDEFNPIGHFF